MGNVGGTKAYALGGRLSVRLRGCVVPVIREMRDGVPYGRQVGLVLRVAEVEEYRHMVPLLVGSFFLCGA